MLFFLRHDSIDGSRCNLEPSIGSRLKVVERQRLPFSQSFPVGFEFLPISMDWTLFSYSSYSLTTSFPPLSTLALPLLFTLWYE